MPHTAVRNVRQASNRTYERILASLPPNVARRYGYIAENGAGELEIRLRQALDARNWLLVSKVAKKLGKAE